MEPWDAVSTLIGASIRFTDDAPESAVSSTVTMGVEILAVACVIGVLTKFVRVPYTIALVLAGLGIAVLGLAPEGARLDQDLVLLLFLPPLLFQAGLHTDLNLLRRGWAPVLVMALPGVVVTSMLVALAVRWVLPAGHQTWAVALMFGAVMAPTDPISVMATFKTAGVPDKLKTMVEGESLFNDGTAVALFAVLRAGVVAGAAAAAQGEAGGIDVAGMGLTFVLETGVGTIVGLGLGLAAYWLLGRLEDHTLETAITVALAWGAFVLAQNLHASGVIAVAVASLIMGNYGKVLSMSEDARKTLAGFWDSLDFVVNSVLFLLIGFELSDPAVGGVERLTDWRVLSAAGATIVALHVSRAMVVYPTCLLLKRYWPSGWKHVIWWGGLKGSLSLALILGLPTGEVRQFLAPVAFIVVLVSLLGQGITMPMLIRRVPIWLPGKEEEIRPG